MAKVTIALSRKVSDNNYGSFEATVGLEDEVPKGTDRDSFAAATRSWCKAFLDQTLSHMEQAYLSKSPIEKPYVDINAALSEGEAGAQIDQDVAYLIAAGVPTDADLVKAGVQEKLRQTAQAMETPPQGGRGPEPSPGEVTRVPIDEAGNELLVVFVDRIEIATTKDGDNKYGKVYSRDLPGDKGWVPAWSKVMEQIWNDISDMDDGPYSPPRPGLKARVSTKDWANPKDGKTYAYGDIVVDWE